MPMQPRRNMSDRKTAAKSINPTAGRQKMCRLLAVLFVVILCVRAESWLAMTLATTPAGAPTRIRDPGVCVPDIERAMSLDVSRGDVRVTYDAPSYSSAYVMLFGSPYDMYQIGEQAAMLVTYAAPIPTTAKCAACHGVLGLG